MTFLALVGALLIEQWQPLRTGNRLYVGFARYVNSIGRNFNAGQYRDGVISWALAIVPVALLTFAIYAVSRHFSGLLALAWNIAVLYLALGFRQFRVRHHGDVARIEQGPLAERFSVRYNGSEAVALGVLRNSTANPLDLSKAITAMLPRIREFYGLEKLWEARPGTAAA